MNESLANIVDKEGMTKREEGLPKESRREKEEDAFYNKGERRVREGFTESFPGSEKFPFNYI